MAQQTLDPKEDQDTYNPGDLRAREQFPDAYASRGVDQLESYANNPESRTQDNPKDTPPNSIAATKQREADAGPKNFYIDKNDKKQKITFKSFFKRKGPTGIIISLVLGGGGMLSFFGGPGLLIVDLKEKMQEAFHDQLAAMDIRATAIVKSKLKGTLSGVCAGKINLRCKYNKMPERYLKKLEASFEKAGGKVNTQKLLVGRRVTSFEMPDGTKYPASEYLKATKIDKDFRSLLAQGWDANYASMSDAQALKTNAKLGVSKQANISPETETGSVVEAAQKAAKEAAENAAGLAEDAAIANAAAITAEEAAAEAAATDEVKAAAVDARAAATAASTAAEEAAAVARAAAAEVTRLTVRKQLMDIASGAAAIEAKTGVSKTDEPCDGGDDCNNGKRTTYTDATGATISESAYNAAVENDATLGTEFKKRRALAEIGSSAVGATLKSVVTAADMGVGALDDGCTGYMIIRTVAFAAKYIGALQQIRYAYAFFNLGDIIKAGDAVPEQTNPMGNILMTPNSEGKTAMDSYGYKYAAYGDTAGMPRTEDIEAVSSDENSFQISDESKDKILLGDEVTRYINGQLVSDNLLTDIIDIVGGAASVTQADEICAFVKSGWGQTITIGASVAGLAVAFFTGGLSLGWSAAVKLGVSVSIAIAINLVIPKLSAMAEGRLITGDENGNQAGNAITGGAEAYNDQTSQARGLPALQQEDAVAYQELTEQTIAKYKEIDRAEHSPLDPTNRNTFMGTIVSTLLPYTAKFSSVTGGLSSMTQLTTASLAKLIPTSHAQDKSEQFKVCTDTDYKRLNVAAGPFCGVRHGLKAETLAIEPTTAMDFMLHNGLVNDDETGSLTDSENEYGLYVKNCMERSVSLGGYVSEDDTNKGEECIQGNASNNPSAVINCVVNEDGSINNDDPCKSNCTSGSDADNTECRRNMFRLFFIDMSIQEGMENGYPGSEQTVNNNGEVKSPVSPGHTVTSGYGPRGSIPGAPNGTSWHAAIDMISQPDDVFAAMAGKVTAIEGSGANTVTITHADGLKTQYGHMWPQDVTVKVGDLVLAGAKIGKIGCAGEAQGICDGSHLDFSIWIDGVMNKAVYSKYKTAPPESKGYAGKTINPANFLTDNGIAGYEEYVNEL